MATLASGCGSSAALRPVDSGTIVSTSLNAPVEPACRSGVERDASAGVVDLAKTSLGGPGRVYFVANWCESRGTIVGVHYVYLNRDNTRLRIAPTHHDTNVRSLGPGTWRGQARQLRYTWNVWVRCPENSARTCGLRYTLALTPTRRIVRYRVLTPVV